MTHPITACANDLSDLMKSVADVDPMFMSTTDKEAALVALTEARSRLDALVLGVLAVSDDVAERHGDRDVGAWLARTTGVTRAAAARELTLARGLRDHEPTAAALRDGTLRTDQAREIAAAVDALPREVDAETRVRAEGALLDLAGQHDAKALRQLGKRILDVVAPQVGESHEAALLAREERRADAVASFSMVDDGHGTCHGRFTVPSAVGTMLRRHLLALANPARHQEDHVERPEPSDGASGAEGAPGAAPRLKPLPERLGAALVEYVERYPAEHTPQSGGVNATIVVTMTLDQLLGEDQSAVLVDDGTRISPGHARRLACEAGIIPAVLGSRSEVLDLGRERRLFTKAQRVALGLRDRGCSARGCEVSASGCHAHHDTAWSRGGPSDLRNGRLLCPFHHRKAHNARYDCVRHPDHTVSFVRRT